MPNRPVGQAAQQGARVRASGARRRTHAHPRMPSTAGYMFAAGGLSLALFLAIWMLLRWDGGEESPWVPAGLAAGFVILLAAAAREVVMRRAWARYTREMEMLMGGGAPAPASLKTKSGSFVRPDLQAQVAALRGLQQRLAELDAAGATAASHQEACKLCEQYLAHAEEVLRAPGGAAEMRAALRSGQERVGTLRRRHMLAWARGEATRLTQEAQRRVRPSDKIETARGALEVLEEALRAYPGERELLDSADALRNFVASVKVGQWVEMAERAAFRGKFQRAVGRYRDALFYLSRAEMSEDARAEAAGRIQREIDMLRARSRTADAEDASGDGAAARPATGRDAVGGEEVLG